VPWRNPGAVENLHGITKIRQSIKL